MGRRNGPSHDIHELVSSYNTLFSFYTGTGAFEENVLSEDLSLWRSSFLAWYVTYLLQQYQPFLFSNNNIDNNDNNIIYASEESITADHRRLCTAYAYYYTGKVHVRRRCGAHNNNNNNITTNAAQV